MRHRHWVGGTCSQKRRPLFPAAHSPNALPEFFVQLRTSRMPDSYGGPARACLGGPLPTTGGPLQLEGVSVSHSAPPTLLTRTIWLFATTKTPTISSYGLALLILDLLY